MSFGLGEVLIEFRNVADEGQIPMNAQTQMMSSINVSEGKVTKFHYHEIFHP